MAELERQGSIDGARGKQVELELQGEAADGGARDAGRGAAGGRSSSGGAMRPAAELEKAWTGGRRRWRASGAGVDRPTAAGGAGVRAAQDAGGGELGGEREREMRG